MDSIFKTAQKDDFFLLVNKCYHEIISKQWDFLKINERTKTSLSAEHTKCLNHQEHFQGTFEGILRKSVLNDEFFDDIDLVSK